MAIILMIELVYYYINGYSGFANIDTKHTQTFTSTWVNMNDQKESNKIFRGNNQIKKVLLIYKIN